MASFCKKSHLYQRLQSPFRLSCLDCLLSGSDMTPSTIRRRCSHSTGAATAPPEPIAGIVSIAE